VTALYSACSDHDDIVLGVGRIPCLRQQTPGSDGCCLSLADFVRPATRPEEVAYDNVAGRVALFAATVDTAMETDLRSDAYERMLSQTLADRLAEATAEVLHREVRCSLWGYAPQERLDTDALLRGDYQGIRPAVGYPSLPDTSLNFLLERLLRMSEIGIRLTETGAMRPHASVSGLMLAHPAARYFDLGRIDETQLADYARRRGMPAALMRRFLAERLDNK
jgi:cobalamin-dependent methionine synthase I